MESQSRNKSRRKSSIPRMPITKQDLVGMDPEKIFVVNTMIPTTVMLKI